MLGCVLSEAFRNMWFQCPDLKMWKELRVDQEWSNTSHDNVLVTSKTKSQTDRITFEHFNNAEIKGNSI